MTHTKQQYIDLQNEIDAMVEELRGLNDPFATCWQCEGTGMVPWFKHVAEGVCFPCNGTGKVRAAALPEDMGVCMGCDVAIAKGLIWGAWQAEVCPDCWEHVHGYPRWETEAERGDREIAEAGAFAERMREQPCSYRAHTDADHSGCHLIKPYEMGKRAF